MSRPYSLSWPPNPSFYNLNSIKHRKVHQFSTQWKWLTIWNVFYTTTFIHYSLACLVTYNTWSRSPIEPLYLGSLLQNDKLNLLNSCIWDHFNHISTLKYQKSAFALLQYGHLYPLKHCSWDHFYKMTTFTHWHLVFRISLTSLPLSYIEILHLGPPLLYDHLYVWNSCIWDRFGNITAFSHCFLVSGTTLRYDYLHQLKPCFCD